MLLANKFVSWYVIFGSCSPENNCVPKNWKTAKLRQDSRPMELVKIKRKDGWITRRWHQPRHIIVSLITWCWLWSTSFGLVCVESSGLCLFPNNLREVLAGFHTWWVGSVSIAVEKRSRDTNEFVDLNTYFEPPLVFVSSCAPVMVMWWPWVTVLICGDNVWNPMRNFTRVAQGTSSQPV